MKKSKIFILVLIISLIVISYLIYRIILEEKRIKSLDNEIKYFNGKIEQLKEEKETIKNEIQNSSNPEYLEQVARNKLNMVMPNDTVYVFGD